MKTNDHIQTFPKWATIWEYYYNEYSGRKFDNQRQEMYLFPNEHHTETAELSVNVTSVPECSLKGN